MKAKSALRYGTGTILTIILLSVLVLATLVLSFNLRNTFPTEILVIGIFVQLVLIVLAVKVYSEGKTGLFRKKEYDQVFLDFIVINWLYNWFLMGISFGFNSLPFVQLIGVVLTLIPTYYIVSALNAWFICNTRKLNTDCAISKVRNKNGVVKGFYLMSFDGNLFIDKRGNYSKNSTNSILWRGMFVRARMLIFAFKKGYLPFHGDRHL